MSRETFEKLPEGRKELILSTGIRMFSLSPYSEVSTDSITRACGISKGILFHYFGSKRAFYLYCLEKSLERLTRQEEEAGGTGFHEILFSEMSRKMALCMAFRDEMHLVNMASRDASAEIAREKAALLAGYTAEARRESARTLRKALDALPLADEGKRETAAEGLQLYVQALLNRYLLR